MALFNNKKEKQIKEKAIQVEENSRLDDNHGTESSAAIAKRRSKDVLANKDEVEAQKRVDFELSEETGDENLDNLFNNGLADDMFNFSQDIEKDISVGSRENDEKSLFDPDEIFNKDIPNDSDVIDDEFSELDDSFRKLYNEESTESSSEDVAESANSTNETLENFTEKSIVEKNDVTNYCEENNVTVEVNNLASKKDLAGEKDIFMAMQVFDSVDGDYNLDSIDAQLVFDTDDETLLSLGDRQKSSSTCNTDEFNIDEHIMDSSEL